MGSISVVLLFYIWVALDPFEQVKVTILSRRKGDERPHPSVGEEEKALINGLKPDPTQHSRPALSLWTPASLSYNPTTAPPHQITPLFPKKILAHIHKQRILTPPILKWIKSKMVGHNSSDNKYCILLTKLHPQKYF